VSADAERPRHVPHVYAHFPFCVQKCPYCDFNSHARREREIEPYVDALLAEARTRARGCAPRTLFVGGGTPTHAPAAVLERYVHGLADIVGRERLVELTVEANPGSLTAEKVAALVAAGVTRVSMGAQTFHAGHLKTLGREHAPDDVERGVALLRDGGIERLSVDLILALPGQTLEQQAADVERALALKTEHVSAYVLTYEEGTAFTRWMREGRLPAPDSEREAEHQDLVCERLAAGGLARYEVSNHARPGAECLHNLGYWENADWWGLGAGAHGHLAGRRWKNVSDPAAYVKSVAASGAAEEWSETADATTRLFDTLMMGLRLVRGVDLDLARERTGLDARRVHGAVLARLTAEGLLRFEGSRLVPTARGLDLASYVARELLDEPAPPAQEKRPSTY
jgi:oxygen-independent coproporphyrinogen-3 oxidase